MGKLPGILLALIAAWVAWNVYQEGPKRAIGGLFELMSQPQYGEADAPSRSGTLADRILRQEEEPAPPSEPE